MVPSSSPQLKVPRVEDFALDGAGSAAPWKRAAWTTLHRVGDGHLAYRTRAKVLWSRRGLYVLWDCVDRRLDCTLTADNADLFTEDVAELFLWPCEDHPVYFEYEISPLGFQLPIAVINDGQGRFHGWNAWKEDSDPRRRIRRATAVRRGAKAAGAACSGWSAEIFIPFELLSGFINHRPRPGDRWRANIYRIDVAGRRPSHWAWSRIAGPSFHAYREFGTFVFAT